MVVVAALLSLFLGWLGGLSETRFGCLPCRDDYELRPSQLVGVLSKQVHERILHTGLYTLILHSGAAGVEAGAPLPSLYRASFHFSHLCACSRSVWRFIGVTHELVCAVRVCVLVCVCVCLCVNPTSPLSSHLALLALWVFCVV